MLNQNLVQGWVKTWSKYVAQQNWTKFWLKKWCFFCLFCSFFLKISFSLQKEEYFLKNKKKKKKENLEQALTQKKGYFWTKFWLYSIYTYAIWPLWCLHFGLFLVIFENVHRTELSRQPLSTFALVFSYKRDGWISLTSKLGHMFCFLIWVSVRKACSLTTR